MNMDEQLCSDYFYKLDAKLKARYQEKTSYIKREDPYALKKSEFCRDVAHLPPLRLVTGSVVANNYYYEFVNTY